MTAGNESGRNFLLRPFNKEAAASLGPPPKYNMAVRSRGHFMKILIFKLSSSVTVIILTK